MMLEKITISGVLHLEIPAKMCTLKGSLLCSFKFAGLPSSLSMKFQANKALVCEYDIGKVVINYTTFMVNASWAPQLTCLTIWQ